MKRNRLTLDLSIRQPNGTEIALPSTPGREANPAWSPDGSRIVFEYTLNNLTTLYMVNADGSDFHRVTTHPATSPAWSPDGSLLAYIRTVPGATPDALQRHLAYVTSDCREGVSCVDEQLAVSPSYQFSDLDWSATGDRLMAVQANMSAGGPGVTQDVLVEYTLGRSGTSLWVGSFSTVTQAPSIASPSYNATGNAFAVETLRTGDPTTAIERWTRPNATAAWVSPLNANNTRIGPILYGASPALVDGGSGGPQPPTTCHAVVNASPDFALRSGPSLQNEIITRLPDGTALVLLGQSRNNVEGFIWYRATVNNISGWLRSDGVSIDSLRCPNLLIIDPTTNEPLPADFDYVLDEIPPAFWASLPCTAQDLPEEPARTLNWVNCSRVVYHAYYYRFRTLVGRDPRVSDVIAAVYSGEVPDAVYLTVMIMLTKESTAEMEFQ